MLDSREPLLPDQTLTSVLRHALPSPRTSPNPDPPRGAQSGAAPAAALDPSTSCEPPGYRAHGGTPERPDVTALARHVGVTARTVQRLARRRHLRPNTRQRRQAPGRTPARRRRPGPATRRTPIRRNRLRGDGRTPAEPTRDTLTDMIRIRVCDDDPSGPNYALGGTEHLITGVPNHSFADALSQELAHPDGVGGGSYSVVVGDANEFSPIVIDDAVTLAQVAVFVDNQVLHIDHKQRGGQAISTLVEIVSDGLTLLVLVRGYTENAREARLDSCRYDSQRGAARNWIAEGCPEEPELALQQAVKADNEWNLNDFAYVFGLDVEQSVRLLRSMNYKRVFLHGYAIWRDQDI